MENRLEYVHRIKFALEYGYLPVQIDHKNRKPADNRLSNLRAVTPSENQLNRKLLRNNKSGYSGVHFTGGRWKAQLVRNRRRINLGQYKSKKAAILAVKRYCRAKGVKHGKEEN